MRVASYMVTMQPLTNKIGNSFLFIQYMRKQCNVYVRQNLHVFQLVSYMHDQTKYITSHILTHNVIITYIITVKSETSKTLGDQFHKSLIIQACLHTVQRESLAERKLGEFGESSVIRQTFFRQMLRKSKFAKVSPCQTFPLYGNYCLSPLAQRNIKGYYSYQLPLFLGQSTDVMANHFHYRVKGFRLAKSLSWPSSISL